MANRRIDTVRVEETGDSNLVEGSIVGTVAHCEVEGDEDGEEVNGLNRRIGEISLKEKSYYLPGLLTLEELSLKELLYETVLVLYESRISVVLLLTDLYMLP